MSGRHAALRGSLARSCRVLAKLRLTSAFSGHQSARLDAGTILVRARGRDESPVAETRPEDLIVVDLDGHKVEGRDGLEPPQEVFIHCEIYRARPDVQSVAHLHPPSAVLLTASDAPLLAIYGAFDPSGLRLLLDGVPLFDRSVLVSDPELGRELVATLGSRPACLMRGHGVTTTGATVEEASLTAIRLNTLLEMNYRARLIGEPRAISQEDIEVFQRRWRAEPAARGARRSGAGSLWSYYCTVAGETDATGDRARR